MKTLQDSTLDAVFGPGSGDDPAERASQSSVEFVRSVDQIAFAVEGARGRRLSAREALDAYGLDVLRAVADEGSALLASDPEAAGRVLRERHSQLNLTVPQVARRVELTADVVEAIEQSRRRPVREYERVARALGLDERMISFSPDPIGNDRIAVRLRTLQQSRRAGLSTYAVGSLAEAAWVAATQIRLERDFGLNGPEVRFAHSTDYGGPGWPPWRAGFELATRVREELALGEAPIASLRDLCERRLRVPVIQAELGDDIAGATIESEGCRAIVQNLSGRNREVFIRRATLAHELGHILFDPPRRLDDLRVDAYDELERAADQLVDPVEQRANAFSVELIAPVRATLRRYEQAEREPLRAVMDHFGVSFTVARYQVWNGLERQRAWSLLTAPNSPPGQEWEGQEAYTVDYHPIRALARRPSRAGRFSALALRAATERLISWDTASEWLMAPVHELQAAETNVRSLFPEVFT